MTEVLETVGEWYSLQDAAARLGVSIDTVRKKAKNRELLSRQVPMPQGFRYEVFLGEFCVSEEVAPTLIDPPRTEAPPVDLAPLKELIEELVNRNAQLERENGALSAKLEAAESQLLALTAPGLADPPTCAPRRPWWCFW